MSILGSGGTYTGTPKVVSVQQYGGEEKNNYQGDDYEKFTNKRKDTSIGVKQQDNSYERETVEDVKNYPFRSNAERGITIETMKLYGVKAGLSQGDGKTVEAWYFPSYSQDGILTGYSKQDLTKDKSEKFHWSTIGTVSIENKMFGQEVAEKLSGKNKQLIVTEGQWDCLSAYQSRKYALSKTDYSGKSIFCVSIPMGTLNAKKSFVINRKFITNFEEVLIHFDSDSASEEELKKGIKKGKQATQDVINCLVNEDVIVKEFPHHEKYKDASDYLQDGVKRERLNTSMEFLDGLYWKAKHVDADNIISASDFDFDELVKPLDRGIKIEEFPQLDDMLYGLRLRECTTITSESGAGKTTLVSKLSERANKEGWKVGSIYLEEGKNKTMQRTLASQLGVGFKEYRRNPLGHGFTKEQIHQVFMRIVQRDDVMFLDHFGSLPIAQLMQKIKHMHIVGGCKLIVVDHLSMVISGSDIKDERKELDMVMTQIASFCENHDVHVLLVVHINRKNGEGQVAPKDKQGNEKPFWVKITLNSLRGSAGIEQLSSNVIAIEREYLPNRKRGRVRFVLLKNREGGELGEADYFKINPITWQVELCPDDDTGATTQYPIDQDPPRVIDTHRVGLAEIPEGADLPF